MAMTIQEFIAANGITMTSKHIGFRTDEGKWAHDAWRCILRMQGRRMQVTYNMGIAYEGKPPEIEGVLDSMAMDASMLENSQWNIDQFMAESGLDDYGRGRRIFNATVRQTESLQRLLGHDADLYQMLLWDTERL